MTERSAVIVGAIARPTKPAADRRPLDGFAVTALALLCLCWGLRQVAVKSAAAEIGPLAQAGFTSAVAAILVFAVSIRRGSPFSPGRRQAWAATLRPGLAAGACLAAGFLCVAAGLHCTTASHMTVFAYTAPVFASLGLHRLVPEERLRGRQWVGVGLAFAGVAAASSQCLCPDGGGSEGFVLREVMLGDALGICAGLFSGATTVLVRRTGLADAPPAPALFHQLAVCGAALLGAAAFTGELEAVAWDSLGGVTWASLLFQAVVVSFASYLAWHWLLRRYVASRLAAFSFLTPVFGVAAGVLVLGEPVGERFAVGAAVVAAGVLLASLRKD